jgi:N-acetylglucosaminyldiphosphoundecaprenol N-acetyl-beta-D-mannosaminyltransferase
MSSASKQFANLRRISSDSRTGLYGKKKTVEIHPSNYSPRQSVPPVSQRYHFLDISIDALTHGDLDATLQEAIENQRRLLIGNHNLHSLYLFHHSSKMRSFYAAADRIHADGISIVWLARLFGVPLARAHRTGYLDWLPTIMSNATQRGWRVFYLGSKPGVLEEGLYRLRKQWPGLQIDGRHGYFDKTLRGLDNLDVLTEIAEYKPDLLMVGMGMPVQEQWIVENLRHLPISVVVACGALMDYVAGEAASPPRWLGPIGLEWAFRLLNEPRRLGHRYLVEPWSVLEVVWKHLQTRPTVIGAEKA